MRILLLSIFAAWFAFSCTKKAEPEVVTAAQPAETASVSNVPKSGKEMVEASDCTSCHQVDSKLIGPSYNEIAAKYSAKDTEALATKIIEGGSGIWGPAAMTPHPTLAKADAIKMVEYILTLKK